VRPPSRADERYISIGREPPRLSNFAEPDAFVYGAFFSSAAAAILSAIFTHLAALAVIDAEAPAASDYSFSVLIRSDAKSTRRSANRNCWYND
jgi:hypothetical protein